MNVRLRMTHPQLGFQRRDRQKKRIQWWSQANWLSLKEALVKSQDPHFRGQWDVACLELGLDRVPRQTIYNVLRRIGRKPITYKNVFPDKKRALLSNSPIGRGVENENSLSHSRRRPGRRSG